MIIILPSAKLINISSNNPLESIEEIGRVCHKTENKIEPGSAKNFVQKYAIDLHHETLLEHVTMTFKVVCDRGISHELVRHRIATFHQESTRYCRYRNNLTFIKPLFFKELPLGEFHSLKEITSYSNSNPNFDGEQNIIWYNSLLWVSSMLQIETCYIDMLNNGLAPQEARSVLPNSLKTEINLTMNLRELRHFFNLRLAFAAHPQMIEVARLMFSIAQEKVPLVFDDISLKFNLIKGVEI